MIKIRVSAEFPPIPDNQYDYMATLDDYEPGDPIGYGPTVEAAIQDLKDQLKSGDSHGNS